jgi:hypothetical protein
VSYLPAISDIVPRRHRLHYESRSGTMTMTTDPRLWRRKVVYPVFSENVDQLDFQLYIVQIRISGDPFLFASTNPNILSLILPPEPTKERFRGNIWHER